MSDSFTAKSAITSVGHKARKSWERPQDSYDILTGAAREKAESKGPDDGDDLDLITGLPKGAKPPVIPDEVIEARKGPKKAEPMPVAGAPTNQLPRPPRNRDHAKELNNDDELDLVTGLPKSRSGGSIASRGSTARAFQEDPDEDVDVITGEKRAIFSHKFPPTNSHRKE